MATHGLPTWPWSDTDPASLPEPERLLLDALRAWAAPGPAGPLAQAALVLTAAGVEAAARPLDHAMRALPGLHPSCQLCPRMNDGEGALLLAIAAAQRGRRSLALALLHRLAPPLAAYQAMAALLSLACTLKHGGTRLHLAL